MVRGLVPERFKESEPVSNRLRPFVFGGPGQYAASSARGSIASECMEAARYIRAPNTVPARCADVVYMP